MDRAETELYDGDAAFEDALEQANTAEERRVRRRHEADVVAIPSTKAGPPARRLGIETIAVESIEVLPVSGVVPVGRRGAGVALTRSSRAGFPSRAVMPSFSEPRPNPYELEAAQYLQRLVQYEEDAANLRSEAAAKNEQLWNSEKDSTAKNLVFRQEARCLEDQARSAQHELAQSEARETRFRRETMERSAHIAADANSQNTTSW